LYTGITQHYHTSNSRKCMRVSGEALQLHSVYKKLYLIFSSHMRIYIGTASHVRILSGTTNHMCWMCNEIEGSCMIKSLSP